MTIARIRPCLWCERTVTFTFGRGWIHEGGGMYVLRCIECGWKDSSYPDPKACPDCGRVDTLRDDHIAQPRFS